MQTISISMTIVAPSGGTMKPVELCQELEHDLSKAGFLIAKNPNVMYFKTAKAVGG